MTPNPIRKVLSSISAHSVRALLMGGQACVFYGAAEFSRDTGFAIPADPRNLARLRGALKDSRWGLERGVSVKVGAMALTLILY